MRWLNRVLLFDILVLSSVSTVLGQDRCGLLMGSVPVSDIGSPFPRGFVFRAGDGNDGSWQGTSDAHRGVGACAVDFNVTKDRPNGSTFLPYADNGSPIVSVADGRVVEAGWSGGYGFRVLIQHTLDQRSLYGHLSIDPQKKPRLRIGDIVRKGDVIGYMGNTGNSTGPHLHFAYEYLSSGAWSSVDFATMDGQNVNRGSQLTSTNSAVVTDTRVRFQNYTLVRNADGNDVYMAWNNQLKPFSGYDYLESWQTYFAQEPLYASQAVIDAYSKSPNTMSYRPGTMLRVINAAPAGVYTGYWGTTWLVMGTVDSVTRRIVSETELNAMAMSHTSVLRVAQAEIDKIAVNSTAPPVCLMSSLGLDPGFKKDYNRASTWTCDPPPPALVATCSPSSTVLLAGGSKQFSLSPLSGGTPPYSVSWSSLGATPTSGTGTIYTASYPTMGNYTVTATVTDNGNTSAGQQQSVTTSCQVQVNGTEPPLGSGDLSTTSLYTDPSLVAYYRFEGNANDSKGVYHGAGSNVTYGTSAGKFGQGAAFNGSSSKIDLPNLGVYGSTPRTVSLWLNTTSTTTEGYALQWGQNGTNSFYGVSVNGFVNGSVAFHAYGNDWSTPAGSITASQWYNVVVVYAGGDTSTGASIYINGVRQSLTNYYGTGTINTSNANYALGYARVNGGGGWFNGSLDDVAIFNRALSATEVASLYGGGTASPTTGTVSVTVSGYSSSVSCTLNGTSISAPTTLSNQAAGSYTLACTAPSGYTISSISPSATQTLSGGGTVSFGVTFSNASGPIELSTTSLYTDPSLVAYYRFEGNANDSKGVYHGAGSNVTYGTSAGKFGQGAAFNGSSSYIQAPGSIVNSGTAISVSLWVLNGNASQDQDTTIFSNQQDNGNHGVILARTTTGYSNAWGCFFGNGVGGWNGYSTGTFTLSISEWMHVVCVIDGNSRKVYLNGALTVNDAPGSGNISFTSANSFTIGKYPTQLIRFFNGKVDDVAVFNRALSATEVASLYGGGGAPSATLSVTGVSTSSSLQAGTSGGLVQTSATYANIPTGSTITQTISDLPNGVTATSPSQTVSGNGTATLSSNFTVASGTAVGTYPLVATVTVASVSQTVNASLQVTAAAPTSLTGSCVVNGQSNPLTLQVGNQATYAITASGGTGTKHYAWYNIAGNDSNAASQIYNTAGTYNVYAVVSDSASTPQQATVNCPQVTVSAPPAVTASCFFNPSTIALGTGSTMMASAIGGVSPYTFLFPGGTNYVSNNSSVVMPSSRGVQSYQVTAKDTQGYTGVTSCSITVY